MEDNTPQIELLGHNFYLHYVGMGCDAGTGNYYIFKCKKCGQQNFFLKRLTIYFPYDLEIDECNEKD